MSGAAAMADELEQPELRVHIRDGVDADLNFLRHSWARSSQLSASNHDAVPRHVARDFDEDVRRGVLAERDTRILVACDPDRRRIILGWLCYTPGIPTVHWAYVRPEMDGVSLRRRGIFGIMLSAIGVRDGGMCVYTSRPQEHAHPRSNRQIGLEDALRDAAERHGITVRYQSIREFLGR